MGRDTMECIPRMADCKNDEQNGNMPSEFETRKIKGGNQL